MKKKKHTILYVDDEKENLSSFRSAFWMHYHVLVTTCTNEAFSILSEQPVKIVISDQRMPQETGLQFIQRAKEQFPDVVYMVLSAYSDMDAVMKAINEVGIYRFILKPWDNSDMIQTLNNAIERYDLSQKNKELLSDLKVKNEELVSYNEELTATTSHLVELNEELAEAKERAEESDRLKSAFLANMSHEIRTPMNGILGFTNLLKKENLTTEKLHNYVDVIQRNGARMLNIINDIIDISKIESGQVEVQHAPTDINALLESIQKFFELEAREKQLKLLITQQVANDDKTLNTDATKLSQILSNLVKNAIKYTDHGHIELGCRKDSPRGITFFVADTGIGIEQEMQQKIFDRFIQAGQSNNYPRDGAGLGLAITKAYTEMLGGKISLESKVGQGSRFTVYIPA